MKITKYEHACFSVENEGQLLIVDPGEWTRDLGAPENVGAIVITHEHTDHFDPAAIDALVSLSPEALVVAHESITGKLSGSVRTKAVSAGDSVDIGTFHLEFFGGQHATIHKSLPPLPNLGVMINDRIYYPGDSFAEPGKPVDTLAIPAAAPWMNIGQAMDYLAAIHPRFAFPTHDAIYTDEGKQISDRLLGMTAQNAGTEYRRLVEPMEL